MAAISGTLLWNCFMRSLPIRPHNSVRLSLMKDQVLIHMSIRSGHILILPFVSMAVRHGTLSYPFKHFNCYLMFLSSWSATERLFLKQADFDSAMPSALSYGLSVGFCLVRSGLYKSLASSRTSQSGLICSSCSLLWELQLTPLLCILHTRLRQATASILLWSSPTLRVNFQQ